MAISIDKYVDINSASSGAGSGDSVPDGSSDIQLFRDPVSGRYFTPSEYVGTVEKRADGKYYANGVEANVVTYQTSVTGGITKIAVVTQAQYDALVAAGTVDASTEYNIVSA